MTLAAVEAAQKFHGAVGSNIAFGIVAVMYRRGASLSLAPAGGSPPRDAALELAIAASLVIAVGSFFGIDSLLDVIDSLLKCVEAHFAQANAR